MSSILGKVDVPRDLDGLSVDDLYALCGELRERIIETVSQTGGHLAANLGVVELTVALLRVFDPPRDKIVWDVSHQTYSHKLLTGRKDRFHTLRQYGGLSGFLKRAESEYDAFGAGHSGTALSSALGMAAARDRRDGREHVVAVLGDGAAGCGIALEAMNHIASTTRRFIVVLNDNKMSIGANVGSLARILGNLLANPRYNHWKRSVEAAATRLRMGWFRGAYYRIEEAVKSLFLRSVVFEEMGLRYIGPIDGHNLLALIDALTIARDSEKPILLHVSTLKGKGYSYAEKLPEKWHGIGSFDVETGETAASGGKSYSQVFGETLEQLAAKDPAIVAITAAMPSGTGLAGFARRFPDRFFDVGISEEHAVVFAAGLATEGLKPVFAVYSTFLQRAVDCVIHDVCLQNLPVVLCLDRAGIVGDDGPTHHGVFDIPLLRGVPGLTIMQPRDEAELADMLYTAFKLGRPVVLRYPRGAGPGTPVPPERREVPVGKAEIVRPGHDVAIWALGDMVPAALRTAELLEAEGVSTAVVNARFVRPLDEALLAEQARAVRLFATVENSLLTGGFGSAVLEALAARTPAPPVVRFGWPDEFIPQGPPAMLHEQYGLTPARMAKKILERLALPGPR